MAPKEISLAAVKEHNTPNDLWVIIENKVYDLTKFRDEHPGGDEVLDEVAGKNATKDFKDAGHSQDAKEQMKKYYIGDLAQSDQKTKIPLRHIYCGVSAAILGFAVVLLMRKLLSKN